MIKKKKKLSRSKLIHKLDSIFSKWLRLIYTDTRGYCSCFTCGKRGHRKTMQCGHFISRSVYRYRRDDTNCKVQCYACNCILHGNYKVYTSKMIDGLGKEKVDQMINNKKVYKISTAEIQEKIGHYERLVEGNLERLGEKGN